MGSHHCVIHLLLYFSAKLETKVNPCSSQVPVHYPTEPHHAPRHSTWNFFRKSKQDGQQVLWKIKKNQQKQCMNKTGEYIFLLTSHGCVLTKERNGISKDGPRRGQDVWCPLNTGTAALKTRVSYYVLGKDSEPFLRGTRVHPFNFLWLLPSNKLVEGGHKGERARTPLPSPSSERVPSALPQRLTKPSLWSRHAFSGYQAYKAIMKR